MKWVFFGTSQFSADILEILSHRGFKPDLIVSAEDKRKGRKMILTPTETKVWAEKHSVECVQLKSLKDPSLIPQILLSKN